MFLFLSPENKILFLHPEQEKDKTYFTDKESGVELELVDSMALLEWFANNYKSFGTNYAECCRFSQLIRTYDDDVCYSHMIVNVR